MKDVISINGKIYVPQPHSNISNGDKYIIGDSHVKTFNSYDIECIEDKNNGAIKVKEINEKKSIYDRIEEIFLEKIESKNSWGKNEIKIILKDSKIQAYEENL